MTLYRTCYLYRCHQDSRGLAIRHIPVESRKVSERIQQELRSRNIKESSIRGWKTETVVEWRQQWNFQVQHETGSTEKQDRK